MLSGARVGITPLDEAGDFPVLVGTLLVLGSRTCLPESGDGYNFGNPRSGSRPRNTTTSRIAPVSNHLRPALPWWDLDGTPGDELAWLRSCAPGPSPVIEANAGPSPCWFDGKGPSGRGTRGGRCGWSSCVSTSSADPTGRGGNGSTPAVPCPWMPASKAAASAAAVPKRSAGCLASARRMAASAGSGRSGRPEPGERGSSCRCFMPTTNGLAAVKGT